MERSLGSPHTVCPPSWGSGRVQQPRGTNDPGCRGRERWEGPRLPAAPRGSKTLSSFPRLTGAFHPTPAFLSHGHVPGFVFPAAEAPPSTRSAPETPHLPGERQSPGCRGAGPGPRQGWGDRAWAAGHSSRRRRPRPRPPGPAAEAEAWGSHGGHSSLSGVCYLLQAPQPADSPRCTPGREGGRLPGQPHRGPCCPEPLSGGPGAAAGDRTCPGGLSLRPPYQGVSAPEPTG